MRLIGLTWAGMDRTLIEDAAAKLAADQRQDAGWATDPLIEDNIKPTRGGQLYIFVNDAVIGFPGLYGALYKNNKGTGQLTVTRTR